MEHLALVVIQDTVDLLVTHPDEIKQHSLTMRLLADEEFLDMFHNYQSDHASKVRVKSNAK
jgi:hypothetical protein